MKRADQPAAPFVFSHNGEDKIFTGLTIREYFASLAMQGILANPEVNVTAEQEASLAVARADALIAELAKPVKP